MPKISVIMPSLNVVKYIDKCISSVINQTLSDIEIICVDAGSTDGTYEKLEEYASKDKRIILVKSDVKSYGRQINMGISIAKGKYIGIVETDDFVETNMYADLYDIAEKNEAEFVKGDYNIFYDKDNGDGVYPCIRMFPKYMENYYNTVISPKKIPILHKMGLNIWRGIYSKDFLVKNNIALNETRGAAFQDTAFYHQIIAKSDRAIFVENSYYRYRLDRDESSFRNPNTLIYTYDEYRHVLEDNIMPSDADMLHYHYIYEKMFTEFMMHIKKYILARNDVKDVLDSVCDKVNWFMDRFSQAIEKNIISRYDFEADIWEEYELLKESKALFIQYVKVNNGIVEAANNEFWEKIGDRKIIVFGTGKYGNAVNELLSKHGCCTECFLDNNEAVTTFKDKMVLRPHEIVEKYSDAVYIIANKLYAKDMKMQLESLGILPENIIKYETCIK